MEGDSVGVPYLVIVIPLLVALSFIAGVVVWLNVTIITDILSQVLEFSPCSTFDEAKTI